MRHTWIIWRRYKAFTRIETLLIFIRNKKLVNYKTRNKNIQWFIWVSNHPRVSS